MTYKVRGLCYLERAEVKRSFLQKKFNIVEQEQSTVK
uniref:Uncharacterized protein n=1 Tax=Rhizophora mucronata TaxID=61149 RepID=A0A2P2J3R0_RHIMU